MKIDFRNNIFDPPEARNYTQCFVDGVKINQVFFADTEAGIVRTYDVLGDGKAHATCEPIPDHVLAEARSKQRGVWNMPLDGAMSRTIGGHVELK